LKEQNRESRCFSCASQVAAYSVNIMGFLIKSPKPALFPGRHCRAPFLQILYHLIIGQFFSYLSPKREASRQRFFYKFKEPFAILQDFFSFRFINQPFFILSHIFYSQNIYNSIGVGINGFVVFNGFKESYGIIMIIAGIAFPQEINTHRIAARYASMNRADSRRVPFLGG
jgi:hypothetical protein